MYCIKIVLYLICLTKTVKTPYVEKSFSKQILTHLCIFSLIL